MTDRETASVQGEGLYPCNWNNALYAQPCDGCTCSPQPKATVPAPSDEAIKAAAKALTAHRTMPGPNMRQDATDALTAAYAIDLPALLAKWEEAARYLDEQLCAMREERDQAKAARTAEIVARIRHSVDVIDGAEVSRTARTLNRIALVIESEYSDPC